MDFGRVSLDSDLILYLFGTPGQHRFWFMWDDLIRGAIGAVVLVDTRRLADSFAAIDYFENRGLPFIVAHNMFNGVRSHSCRRHPRSAGVAQRGAAGHLRCPRPGIDQGHADHARRARPAPAGDGRAALTPAQSGSSGTISPTSSVEQPGPVDRPGAVSVAHLVDDRVELPGLAPAERQLELHRVGIVEVGQRDPDQRDALLADQAGAATAAAGAARPARSRCRRSAPAACASGSPG